MNKSLTLIILFIYMVQLVRSETLWSKLISSNNQRKLATNLPKLDRILREKCRQSNQSQVDCFMNKLMDFYKFEADRSVKKIASSLQSLRWLTKCSDDEYGLFFDLDSVITDDSIYLEDSIKSVISLIIFEHGERCAKMHLDKLQAKLNTIESDQLQVVQDFVDVDSIKKLVTKKCRSENYNVCIASIHTNIKQSTTIRSVPRVSLLMSFMNSKSYMIPDERVLRACRVFSEKLNGVFYDGLFLDAIYESTLFKSRNTIDFYAKQLISYDICTSLQDGNVNNYLIRNIA